ncbi:hypothetical protein LCGC14_1105570 [marine sediment metagenome]|uniref:Uncharacterized protein n=1 Tax=marine sediment metagenome TaxID=412755 RepID=A0A0F9QEH6_9ZZZZ
MPHGAMKDRCKIGTEGTPVSPNPVGAVSYGSEIRCRFYRVRTREVQIGADVAISDVVIEVPKGTTVTSSSTIQVTQRNRAALSPVEFYAVVGEPDNTEKNLKGAIVLNCQLTTVGSTK